MTTRVETAASVLSGNGRLANAPVDDGITESQLRGSSNLDLSLGETFVDHVECVFGKA